jgi:transglutaminase-like putative cysteine protease
MNQGPTNADPPTLPVNPMKTRTLMNRNLLRLIEKWLCHGDSVAQGTKRLGSRALATLSGWWRGSNGIANPFASWRVLRPVAALTLLTFTATALLPLRAAGHIDPAHKAAGATAPPSVERRYSQLLDDVKEQTKRAKAQRSNGKPMPDEVRLIRSHKGEIEALEAEIDAGFSAVGSDLSARNLPPEIVDRHARAVADFKTRQAQFKSLLRNLEDADDRTSDKDRDAAIDALLAFYQQYPQGKVYTPIDPNNLPVRAAKGSVRPPAIDSGGFPPALAMADHGAIQAKAAAVAGKSLPAPSPVDLAATEDAQITQPIRSLATSLDNNTVKIYNWVRNNIEFLPTYGSIQGSDLTLTNKRGNAFDTASLLIALYRAANIPARYVYGTVEVPMNKLMNWVGGASTPNAALSLIGQGGIPSIALVSGGQATAVRMEHVWVEAYVGYAPSRGAINRSATTWVPLDASFKQYNYSLDLDVMANVPFDTQAFVAAAQAGAVVDNTQGSVANLNLANIQAQLTGYRTRAQNYFDATKPNAAVEDVLGRKTVIAETPALLPGTLPYKTVAIGQRYSALPATLRHTVSFVFYASAFDQALDSPGLTYAISLPQLSARRLGVTYVPASAADAQVIANAKQQGSTSLPVYLIRVIPQLQIDGLTVATGSPITMGQSVYWVATIADPLHQATDTLSFATSSGDEIVFGIDGAGLTHEVISQRNDLYASNTASENLFRIALQYWYEYDLFDAYLASRKHAAIMRLPSIGAFSAPLSVSYFFGIPRSGTYQGRSMDVKRVLSAIAAESNETVAALRYSSGIIGSHLEGAIFEQILGKPDGAAVSAVQLLRDAAKQGIKIHRLTSQNADALNSINASAGVKSDIAAALNAGKFVVVPARDPVHNLWFGTGYIVADPVTGAAAYLLDGGLAGGSDPNCDDNNEPPSQPIFIYVLGFLAFLIIMSIIIAAILGSGGTLAPAGAAAAILFAAFFLSPQEAYAGGFNRNECCENAKATAASAASTLNTRLAEWAANVLGLQDRGHWDAIAAQVGRLEDALSQIAKYCRLPPPELDSWSSTLALGQAFLATTPRP